MSILDCLKKNFDLYYTLLSINFILTFLCISNYFNLSFIKTVFGDTNEHCFNVDYYVNYIIYIISGLFLIINKKIKSYIKENTKILNNKVYFILY